MKSSAMMLLHSYSYLLVTCIVIVVIHIFAFSDHLHFPQLRTSPLLTEPTAKPTRAATKAAHTLANPTKELIHGGKTIKKTSSQLPPENKEENRNRTTPFYPQANQSFCDADTKFMPSGNMPLVALVSAPGSGNTWLRHLIEKITGIYTGSVYNDMSLWDGGFLGETEPPRSGRVVVVKMHNIRRMEAELHGIILLIRNPYNAILADFNRLATLGNHKGTASTGAFNSTHWPLFAKCSSQRWQMIALSCIETSVKKLVIYYEDLQADLSQQLRRVVSFLGLPMDDKKLKCALQDIEGNFHRLNRLQFDPFTENITAAVDRNIEDLQEVFHFHKYKGKTLKAYKRNITTSLASYDSQFFGNVCNRILPRL